MNQPASVPLSSDGGYDLETPLLEPARIRALPLATAPDPPNPALDPDLIKTVETGNGPALQAAAAAAVAAAAAMATEPSTPTLSQAAAETSAATSNPAQARAQTQAQPQAQAVGPRLVRKRKPARRKWDLPAWVVSALVHAAILLTLGAMTISTESGPTIKNFNGTTAGKSGSTEDELTKILGDVAETPRDIATGEADAADASSGVSFTSGPPSQTPVVGGARFGPKVTESGHLPQIKIAAPVSPMSLMQGAAIKDLDDRVGGFGRIGGDPIRGTESHEVALDQIAQEILRHLESNKVIVAWMFDESESMRDDQKAIKAQFDRISRGLTEHSPNIVPEKGKKTPAPPLTHAVIGFGAEVHLELEKPTADLNLVARAIDHLRVEPSGVENTFRAVGQVINHYSGLIKPDRRLLIVLVTDESGDDGADVEEARQLAASHRVPIYVIGRQSMFGYPYTHVRYVDPVTKDVYTPQIRRGPETAEIETLQWDGLHDRWEEQPSGFAPYELARLTKETGGIYFLLPTVENQRVRDIEKAYSIDTMKEYIPDYESRLEYNQRRNSSELRKTLFEVINLTRGFSYRRHFPVEPAALREAAEQEYPIVRERLAVLMQIENRLRQLQKLRDREPEKRWQASYDLMLAEIVTYQIKAYEYIACLQEMVARPPKPSRLPSPDRIVEWILEHSKDRKAPAKETEKKYAEAQRLLKQVIERHPKTPWADLAAIELGRGLGVQRVEWSVNSQYHERAKLVPKF